MKRKANVIRDWVLGGIAVVSFFLQWILPALSIYLIGTQILALVSLIAVLIIIIAIWFKAFNPKSPRAWKYVLISVFLISMIYVGWVGSQLRNNGSASIDAYPINSQLTYVAWNASKDRQYDTAISIADFCIGLYGNTATIRENELAAQGEPRPPLEETNTDSNTTKRIYSNNVLNDVGSCYWVKADSLDQLRRTSEAVAVYNILAQDYIYAQVFDATKNSYWSPSLKAGDRLAVLKSAAIYTPTFAPTIEVVAPTIEPSTPTSIPQNATAFLPDAATLYNYPDIWNPLRSQYQYLTAPDTAKYSTTVESTQIYRWGFSWCAATSNQLNNALRSLSVKFVMDNVPVSNLDILQTFLQLNKLQCAAWTTLLTKWRKDAITSLEIDYSISAPIYDSRSAYASSPGDYKQVIIVTTR